MKYAIAYIVFCYILGFLLPFYIAVPIAIATCYFGLEYATRPTKPTPVRLPETIKRITHTEYK